MAGNEAPPFWYEEPGLQAHLLAPVAWVYGAIARRRMDRRDQPEVAAPVICVGNLTVGGTGKTPTALALAEAAMALSHKPGFVTRGYGGTHVRPHLVDPDHDTTRSVGDEPLLLARAAPTVVGANRAQGATLLLDRGADLIIMDDGFQSRSLAIDFALITVDARRGIGNGRVIPAGPLRAPLRDQMRLADLVLRVGEGDGGDIVIRAAARAARPVAQASLVPLDTRALKGKRLLAYCGIGDPPKFFATLKEAGLDVADTYAFGDHHEFGPNDAKALLEKADVGDLTLVTTAKDAVRLSYNDGPLATLRERSMVLDVRLAFEDADQARTIIKAAADTYARRRIG